MTSEAIREIYSCHRERLIPEQVQLIPEQVPLEQRDKSRDSMVPTESYVEKEIWNWPESKDFWE